MTPYCDHTPPPLPPCGEPNRVRTSLGTSSLCVASTSSCSSPPASPNDGSSAFREGWRDLGPPRRPFGLGPCSTERTTSGFDSGMLHHEHIHLHRSGKTGSSSCVDSQARRGCNAWRSPFRTLPVIARGHPFSAPLSVRPWDAAVGPHMTLGSATSPPVRPLPTPHPPPSPPVVHAQRPHGGTCRVADVRVGALQAAAAAGRGAGRDRVLQHT